MEKEICLKPAHFLSAQMALVSTFFQMFIALGMYNFEVILDKENSNNIFFLEMSKDQCYSVFFLPIPTFFHNLKLRNTFLYSTFRNS